MERPKLNPSKSTGLKISKKKRKLRAITNMEFHDLYCYNHINTCQTDDDSDCSIRIIC